MTEERIQKIMARAGIASRRQSETIIEQGRVTVNGEAVSLGDKADPARDTIRVDGEIISANVKLVYILLHKPVGVVSAAEAQKQEKRKTVRDLVPVEGRLYPVGRLDADSEGLILLTNDGNLTQHLQHPRYGHQRTYRVFVRGKLTDEKLKRWQTGIRLEDGKTAPCKVRVKQNMTGGTWLEVVMREGRKRQIRRVTAALNLHVERLIRLSFGKLELGDLPVGEWRHLTRDEVTALRAARKRRNSRRRRGSSGASGKRGKSHKRPGKESRGNSPGHKRRTERKDKR